MTKRKIKIPALLVIVAAIVAVMTTSTFAQGNSEKIRLPVRVHIMTDLAMPHTPTILAGNRSGAAIIAATMTSWFTRDDVAPVFSEVNLIWRQANIEFYVESIVEHQNHGDTDSIASVILVGRDQEGHADPSRIPKIYSCFDASKHHSVIQNLYFFPFTGNTSQGYAGIPGRPGTPYLDSNYVVVGIWSNKYTDGRAPYKTTIFERHPALLITNPRASSLEPQSIGNFFERGSLGRTCAHELGHNLNLSHVSKSQSGRLMGGGSPQGYLLSADEIADARAAATIRRQRAGS